MPSQTGRACQTCPVQASCRGSTLAQRQPAQPAAQPSNIGTKANHPTVRSDGLQRLPLHGVYLTRGAACSTIHQTRQKPAKPGKAAQAASQKRSRPNGMWTGGGVRIRGKFPVAGSGRASPHKHGVQAARLNTSVPLVPPKPKLFFTATSIFMSRAVLAQ